MGSRVSRFALSRLLYRIGLAHPEVVGANVVHDLDFEAIVLGKVGGIQQTEVGLGAELGDISLHCFFDFLVRVLLAGIIKPSLYWIDQRAWSTKIFDRVS